ncbi:MAG TPA: DNA polymerase III subunit alpha [Phycisphaerae bacterium]|nr:DNA polymerase III subunit alpha [Phycisphaerae bacterium]
MPLVADLAELHAGLHLLVEDDSLLGELLRAGIERDRLWLGIDPATQPQSLLRRLAGAGGRCGVRLAATGKALITAPDDTDIARLLAAIRLHTTFEAVRDAQLPHPQAYLRDPEQLRRQLVAFPDAIRNNRLLADRCGAWRFLPRRHVFPAFDCPQDLSAGNYLRQLCREGIARRYGSAPPAGLDSRLARELGLIERMGFVEYFLVVWDIVSYARRRGVPVAGRGSGASSLVAYLLGITNVCPLAFRIPFERFLHEGREDFPDLDVDFCWRIRDDVIDYAIGRWGEDHVAMVSMHTTFQPASAVRETAKVFGMSEEQVTRWVERGADDEELEEGTSDGAKSPRTPTGRVAIRGLSKRILGLPHNLSVHPGGIVIGRKPIDHYAPIQRSAKGVMITQYDKDGVEDVGLVKLDLLGNRNLSTVRYACDLLARRGVHVDIESLSPDDPATLATLRSADTVGCNQLESPAMRNLLRMLRPSGTRDVMKALALIRPGAASIGMKEVFVRRHRGLESPPPAPAAVERILGETYGVMLYEDDVMLVAAAMLGGSLSDGDRFRRAVQKCPDDAARLALSRDFLARCRANGIDEAFAKAMWVQMAKFNAYSFCRAHAASYAVLAYAGAYLKTHYPREFWVAALNNNQSMYHPRVYVEQAKRAAVRFAGPDVNRSGEEFTLDEYLDRNGTRGATGCLPPVLGSDHEQTRTGKQSVAPDNVSGTNAGVIRVGLNFVAGLGPVSVATILDRRQRRPYAGLTDFLRRTGLGREEGRALVLAGAFDFTGRRRPTLMAELDLFFGVGPRLRGPDELLLPAEPTVPDVSEDYTPARKYADQRRILGISIGEHVMALFRPRLAGLVDADSRDIPARVGKRIRLAGLLEAARTTSTRTGGTVQFLTMEDEFGLFEVTLFPDASPRNLRRYGPYIVEGTVEDQYDSLTVSTNRVTLLSPRITQEAEAEEETAGHGLHG